MDKKKLKGQTASIVEIVLGALLVLSGLSQLGAWHANIFMGLGWAFVGMFLIAQGVQWRILLKDYRSYMTLLSNDSSGSIANLASATNSSSKSVKENLEMMIKKGLLENAAINEQAGCIVLAAPTGNPVIKGASPAETRETVTVECQGCGASNEVVKGAGAQCEHCGAPLNA